MSIGCRDLRVTDRGRELLAVDHLEVADGETLAVLGPNGAGKSTLLRALARLGPATDGEVLLDGAPVAPAQLRAAVAAVLQRPVLQRASVLDNAAAGLRLRGVRRARARLLAGPWLDALGIAHLADRHARTLSGGEIQRVAIARALAVRSRVLLLDEPFTGLDATARADLIADLRTALDRSTAAVVLVVLLVARPERCRLLTAGRASDGPAVVVPGTLRRLVPLGGTTRVDVDTAAGSVSVLTTAEVTTTPGDPLRVAVDARDTRECPPRG